MLATKDFFQKKPFYNQQYYIGKLYDEENIVENVQIFVEFSKIQPSIIRGYIIGNEEKHKNIKKIFNSKNQYKTFKSYDMADRYDICFSDKVLFNSISLLHWPEKLQPHFNCIIGYVTLEYLKIITKINSEKKITKIICFYLDTPYENLGKRSSGVLKYDGNVESTNTEKKLEILVEPSLQVKICERFIYYENLKENLIKRVSTGAIEFDDEKNHYEENSFIENSIKIVDDLLILYSFIYGRNITWFKYEYYNGNQIIKFVKSFSIERDNTEYDKNDINLESIIAYPDRIKFIEQSFSKYCELRNNGIDLKVPIIELNMGRNNENLSISFPLLFLGIENIVDMYFTEKKNLSHGKFHKLAEEIRKCVEIFFKKEFILNQFSEEEIKKIQCRIKKKIPELNRPPFKNLLFQIMKDYNINSKSLYPENGEFTLINTRDKIFHSSKEPEVEEFVKEKYRAKIILENLIIKLLGWDKFYYSPHSWERKFLREKE